jgi:putative flippase GtrA
MSPLTRFLRFNLVGLLGIAVQLVALALLNRELPRHYLITSTLAVEFTLLHNFAWHIHYTWPATSQRRTREAPAQLLRFHLSNGLISLLGNLTLMRLFVHSFHSPILIANAITIACCGLANFLLAHHWVFASPRATARRSTRAFIASFVLVFLFAITASAQSPPHSLASRISHLATHGQTLGTLDITPYNRSRRFFRPAQRRASSLNAEDRPKLFLIKTLRFIAAIACLFSGLCKLTFS